MMENASIDTQDYPCIDRSNSIWDRAVKVIPAGTQTLAKGPTQWVRGVAPKFLERARGSHVWDVDGNEYIDLTMAVGPVSLGYAYSAVDDAIRAQLEKGITFTLMHPLEVEVAELIAGIIPGAEMVRFSKTGCDVTSAAVRLARAFTGRPHVLCCGYHGWHDWYVSVTDRALGVPAAVSQLTYTFEYNDLDSVVDAIDDSVAAIILEPAVFEAPKPGFLEGLRHVCDEHGTLLIFDEMWTGFRLALGGAQEYFGVTADLACFSKAIANGMPVSVLTGRANVMKLLEKDVFFFTTFGGEALSLAAAKATVLEMQRLPVLSHLAEQGRKLREGYDEAAQRAGLDCTYCQGFDARSMIQFDQTKVQPLQARSFIQQEMLRCGVLWSGFHNMSYSHTDDDIGIVLDAYSEILPRLQKVILEGSLVSSLRGEPILPSFRRTNSFHTRRRVVYGRTA
jgi:glutamate-1-semialdehyde aminotransferase